MLKVDVGVFAHNEAESIQSFLSSLAEQSALGEYDIRVVILANGCTDDTVPIAEAATGQLRLSNNFEVLELREPGKSRTWNTFTHDIARRDAKYLVYCDADILFARDDTISRLVRRIESSAELAASGSTPTKDISIEDHQLNWKEKLIAANSGTIGGGLNSISGQLYVVRSESVQNIFMPIGLPVEDGFIRAMLLTKGFTAPENLQLIQNDLEIWHIYESERKIGPLLRHQVRLIVGSAINSAIFFRLNSLNGDAKLEEMKEAATNPDWLPNLLRETLPKAPSGWVPFSFLYKRSLNILRRPKPWYPKNLAKLIVGGGFDLVVWVVAQYRMARGVGAGHW